MIYLFLIIVYLGFSLLLGSDIYSSIRLFFNINKYLFYSLFFAIVFLIPFSFINIKSSFIRFVSSSLFSLFINIFLIFIVKWIICLFIKDINIIKIINISWLLLSIIITCYGIFNGYMVKKTYYSVDLGLNNNYRIGLISDLHLGSSGSISRLKKTVKLLNEENLDLVLIAGDVFDNGTTKISNMNEVVSEFSSLNPIYGVYSVLGNHDSGSTFTKIVDGFNKSGINLLIDESVVINGDFNLIGRMEVKPIGMSGAKRINFSDISVNSDLVNIIIDHNPENIDEYNGNNLILCGHTHRGQVFPANLITKFMYKIDYGYKVFGTNHVIVTSGSGTWGLNERIGSNNEVVIIDLK